ncbi:MAG: Cof-type HAD-IIB family hydrolase [Oscillospiraceae bacterium]|nr:Cof-type HAD-IIB family hydrolase [Oscillospiraceae bacterium]
MEKTIKLIACDMDGTLLNSQSQLSDGNRAVILKAIDQGVMFVPSTGRPLCGVTWLIEQLPGDFPVIVCNGAAAAMSKSGRELFKQNMQRSDALEILAMAAQMPHPYILWEGDKLHVSHACLETEIYSNITGAHMHLLDNLDDIGEITKIIWIIPAELGPQLMSDMGERFAGRVNCHTSHPRLLEFVDSKASKGLALAAISEIYGIAPEEMMAIGDANNDISMLEYVGCSVAMANAADDIKVHAKHVTLSNDEDGVAAAIEQFVIRNA